MKSLFACAALACAVAQPAAAAGTFYYVTFGYYEGSDLYRLDFTTHEVSHIGNLGYHRVNSLTADTKGRLFAVGNTSNTSDDEHLLQIDLSTGAATSLGVLSLPANTFVRGLAADPTTGLLHAIVSYESITQNDLIYRIREYTRPGMPTIWFSELLGGFAPALRGVQSAVHGDDGTLYVFDNEIAGLVTVNTSNQQWTDLHPSAPVSPPLPESLEFVDGALYGFDGRLLHINLTNGSITPISDLLPGSDARGLAWVVPEPATIALLAAAPLLLRRRHA